MTVVCVNPMPEKFRAIPKKWLPGCPPIFKECGSGGPSEDDKALARELFKALDPQSQEWYLQNTGGFFADISGGKKTRSNRHRRLK